MAAVVDREMASSETGTPWTDFEHTGPGTLAGRFMRSFWQPVHRAADLKPGQAKPIRVLSEDFTLYRGESGTPYVVAHGCAHRGTQLSTGWVEGECVRCFYHGWKYDGTGQCVEQPAEDAAFAAKVRIASYPTREYLGLIFAYLGEGQPPEFPPIPAFEGEGIIETWVDLFPCNFFQCWENSWDPYHVHFTHRTGGIHRAMPVLPTMTYEETDYGVMEYTQAPGEPAKTRPFVMPNILRVTVPTPNQLQGHGPRLRDSYLIKVPIDDYSHNFFASQFLPMRPGEVQPYMEAYQRYLDLWKEHRSTAEASADILAGKLSLANVKDHPYLALIEDIVSQAGQGLIANRNEERLGKSDAGIITMRRIWSREMRALEQGRSMKAWQPLRDYHTAGAM